MCATRWYETYYCRCKVHYHFTHCSVVWICLLPVVDLVFVGVARPLNCIRTVHSVLVHCSNLWDCWFCSAENQCLRRMLGLVCQLLSRNWLYAATVSPHFQLDLPFVDVYLVNMCDWTTVIPNCCYKFPVQQRKACSKATLLNQTVNPVTSHRLNKNLYFLGLNAVTRLAVSFST